MKEIEILEKRKAREKHFLREDGTLSILASMKTKKRFLALEK